MGSESHLSYRESLLYFCLKKQLQDMSGTSKGMRKEDIERSVL